MALKDKGPIRYSFGSVITIAQQFDNFLTASGGGVTFLSETTDINSAATNDVTLVGAAINDAIYMGCTSQFDGVFLDSNTASAGGARVLEYWNGAAWVSLANTVIAGALLLSADTAIRWDIPTDWAQNTVNSITNFWVRLRTTTVQTTAGTLTLGNPSRIASLTRTLNIAEVTSRTFRSVFVRVYIYNPVAGVNLDFVRVRARLDSGAFAYYLNRVTSIALTGEAQGFYVDVDLTSLFTSSFSTASHTLELQVSELHRGINSLNNNRTLVSAELFVTINAPEDAATQTDTILVGMESILGNLTTTLQSIGSNQIPNLLSGGTPYIRNQGVVIRDMYFVLEGNMRLAGTADCNLAVALDAEVETTLCSIDAENQTDAYYRFTWQRLDMTTNAIHDLKARVTNVAGGVFTNFGGYLVVTFDYTHNPADLKTITRYFNNFESGGLILGTTAAQAEVIKRTLFFEEENVSLLEIFMLFYYSSNTDAGNVFISMGTGSTRTYAVTQGLAAGSYVIFHRGAFDATFARGKNEVSTRVYADTTLVGITNPNSYAFVTFACQQSNTRKSSSGAYLIMPDIDVQTQRRVVNYSIPIPEANYYLNSLFFTGHVFTAAITMGLLVNIHKDSNLGWTSEFITFVNNETTPELAHLEFTGRALASFLRYPGDPDSERINVETLRDYVIEHSAAAWQNLVMFAWWHDYTIEITGTITNFTGDGSGITVDIFRTDNKELVASVVTAVGGTFSFTWYDNTIPLFATARQSGTLVGRSDDGF